VGHLAETHSRALTKRRLTGGAVRERALMRFSRNLAEIATPDCNVSLSLSWCHPDSLNRLARHSDGNVNFPVGFPLLIALVGAIKPA